MIRYDPLGDNLILTHLDPDERKRLEPHCRKHELKLKQHLEPGAEQSEKIYFPISGIVSLVLYMEDGRSGEIALVGREGVIGSGLFPPGKPPNSEAVVQVPGEALALSRSIVAEELNRNGNFYRLLSDFSRALSAQVAQTALCNRHHSIEQQLARWLLMSQDRLRAPDVSMTQDLIATMLGVRREGVSGAANRLLQEGILRYSRGKIRVLDRDGLRAHCCECYEAIHKHYVQFEM